MELLVAHTNETRSKATSRRKDLRIGRSGIAKIVAEHHDGLEGSGRTDDRGVPLHQLHTGHINSESQSVQATGKRASVTPDVAFLTNNHRRACSSTRLRISTEAQRNALSAAMSHTVVHGTRIGEPSQEVVVTADSGLLTTHAIAQRVLMVGHKEHRPVQVQRILLNVGIASAGGVRDKQVSVAVGGHGGNDGEVHSLLRGIWHTLLWLVGRHRRTWWRCTRWPAQARLDSKH
jgi:hypothetical protein